MNLSSVIVFMQFGVAAISLVIAIPKAVKYIRRIIKRIKKK